MKRLVACAVTALTVAFTPIQSTNADELYPLIRPGTQENMRLGEAVAAGGKGPNGRELIATYIRRANIAGSQRRLIVIFDANAPSFARRIDLGPYKNWPEPSLSFIDIDNDGTADFELTREFYIKKNYTKEATLRDFWSEGDDKVIFWKKLNTP